MATFLLEIGTEEIPAGFLRKEMEALRSSFSMLMREEGVGCGNVSIAATPRRLALMADDVAEFQERREEVATGPAVKAAYGADGAPTKALEGFCRANAVTPEAVFIQKTPKGEYIAVSRTIGGEPSIKILERLIPRLIAALPFPKSMRWGAHDLTYARPIRWIAALLDDRIVPARVGDIEAGCETYGHRTHGAGPFILAHAKDYQRVMAEDCRIELDWDARLKKIKDGGSALAAAKNGEVIWRDSLLEEVCGLAEHPVPLLGDFDPEYLEMPDQVLLTSMESHQKSFGVRGQDGKLLPHFLATLNLDPDELEPVKKGWEKVLRARLEDARFFWRTDLAEPLEERQKKLEKVIFIGPLGSMADKSGRLAELCEWLANETGLADAARARRAGELAKNDLVSGMVGEFDSLQGIMGGIYAGRAGEEASVAAAIRDQYLPTGPDSPLPETPLGALLAIADKADTLAGCFALGKIPTGAADPNGLRRAALGILRIYLNLGLDLDMRLLFGKAFALYKNDAWDQPRLMAQLQDFMAGRLRGILLSQGYATNFVDAVLARPFKNPGEAAEKLAALANFAQSPAFIPGIQVLKRIDNILKKQAAPEGPWRKDLALEPEELALANELADILPALENALAKKDYAHALETLDRLQQPVNEFFDHVMVMCEDAALRENRLRLLFEIQRGYAEIADFSRLQI